MTSADEMTERAFRELYQPNREVEGVRVKDYIDQLPQDQWVPALHHFWEQYQAVDSTPAYLSIAAILGVLGLAALI
ncbi:MAG: hypothetical protein KJ709_07640 [Nanoarchaeota archaeon]|nr:hypothetical protein [Nanoarchaeota archaeon]